MAASPIRRNPRVSVVRPTASNRLPQAPSRPHFLFRSSHSLSIISPFEHTLACPTHARSRSPSFIFYPLTFSKPPTATPPSSLVSDQHGSPPALFPLRLRPFHRRRPLRSSLALRPEALRPLPHSPRCKSKAFTYRRPIAHSHHAVLTAYLASFFCLYPLAFSYFFFSLL